ncbi:MAG: hypothetical protein PVH96_09590, partial [Gemmatimonadota bacterium]
DETEIEDLDAVIDDEDDAKEDLDALIAATVAGATSDGDSEDGPVQELEEEPVEVLDIEEAKKDATPYAEAADAAAEAEQAAPGEPPEDTAEEPAPSTEEELAGAIDLGDVSSPELRDRLLAQALAHAEMQDARYRVPFSDPTRAARWKALAAVVLLLVAGSIAVAPPAWVRPEPPAQIGQAARARNIRRALLLQAEQVEAYRIRHQSLPRSLQEVEGRLDGVRYVRSGNRAFQLIAYAPDGSAIVYDSSNPAPEFERLSYSWSVGASP